MDSPLRSILVAVGPGGSPRALEAAAALALRERARLTVLAAVTRPSAFAAAAPVALPYDAAHTPEAECTGRLHRAVASLPAELPVTVLRRAQPVRAALLAELRAGGHDLVVVGAGRRSRVARALLRHAGTPVLVVGAGRPAAAAVRAPELVVQGA